MYERTLVMGILNVTPNSFADGGLYLDPDTACERAKIMELEGADIIDVGGESTHPKAQAVSVEEELKRVMPVIERLVQSVAIPISIDTSKGEVAKEALKAGASMVNDITGLQKDQQMAAIVAQYNCPIVLMSGVNKRGFSHIIDSVMENLNELVDYAVNKGVKKENIILDPGFGIGKSFEENLQLMKNLDQLALLNYPILLGTSRKGTLGKILNVEKEDRMEATLATTTIAIMKRVKIVRVHDVKENVRVARVVDAIYKHY